MQLETASWQQLQWGYAGTINFSNEYFWTLFVENAWIQEGEDGQEKVSAHSL